VSRGRQIFFHLLHEKLAQAEGINFTYYMKKCEQGGKTGCYIVQNLNTNSEEDQEYLIH